MLTATDMQQMLAALLQGWEVEISSLCNRNNAIIKIRLAPKAFGFEQQLHTGEWVPVAIGMPDHEWWRIADMGQPKGRA